MPGRRPEIRVKPFAELLDRLLYAPQRNAKLALMGAYFRDVPDPDRGWGLAALAGSLTLRHAKPGLVRELVAAGRADPVLFAWSHDFVGDLAETAALLWPGPEEGTGDWPRLGDVVAKLEGTGRVGLPGLVAGWLDRLDATGRWALLKLVTGELRVGASARLAKLALAAWGRVDPAEVEEVWHGLRPPYLDLFAWLEGRGPRPDAAEGAAALVFRPLMLAHPLEDADLPGLDLAGHQVEWKWDGIRVQIAAAGGEARLFSRAGDEVGAAFPEVAEAARGLDAVLDGELLVGRPREGGEGAVGGVDVASFNELQQRLNRKAVTAAMLREYPAFVRLYDLLLEGGQDLRALPLAERRRRLEALVAREAPARMDLSPLVPDGTLEELDALRRGARGTPVEGLMLKRLDSPYVAGRPKGPWWKWKRDVRLLDVVVMYAQRGHGKRSSYYSDYTFGCWREGEGGRGDELVPVGKCYSGFTDAELARLDRWVREHTVGRFGPVREVAASPGLVLEVAFDSAHRSARHKSGVAMRFPRVHRIRWDKPAAEADRLETLLGLIE
jgi:DNA ligase-1